MFPAPNANEKTPLHGRLTEKIIGACIQLSRELGIGFVESVYHRALVVTLDEEGVSFVSKPEIRVFFRGHEVGCFYPDFLVEGRVVVEVKAVRAIIPEHQAQLINALRATSIDVGLIINFGRPRVEIKRVYR